MAALAASAHEAHDPWRGFVRALAVAAASLWLLGIAFLLAVDPYDSGRSGVLGRRGLHDQFPYTANASRARDPRFDAAVFGNSHAQPLRPDRLDPLTGASFVSLIMPATYTEDILDVLRWYLLAHPGRPRALVIGLDEYWCLPEMRSNDLRFPEWLYAPSFVRYVAGLTRWRSFEAATARIAFLATGKKGIRPDGYWYYGPMYAQLGLDAREPSYRKLAEEKPFPLNRTGDYPALDRLSAELREVPAGVPVVLVRTPVYRTAIPSPGSDGARASDACAARMQAVAGARPQTVFLDLFKAELGSDERDNFFDHGHYRDGLAVEIEKAIAASLRMAEGSGRP
jgi:hypothetical protein